MGAFSGCSSLVNVIIPETVKEIQPSSFSGCLSLKYIQFEGSEIKVSESMIQSKNHLGFPSAYHSHCETMGSSITEMIHRDVDIETLEVIKIIVPPSTKEKFTFNPVFSTWEYNQMQRRFQITESDENSKCLNDRSVKNGN